MTELQELAFPYNADHHSDSVAYSKHPDRYKTGYQLLERADTRHYAVTHSNYVIERLFTVLL